MTYDRYSVVLHAPREFAEMVREYRRAINYADFPTAPHITLLGDGHVADVEEFSARVVRVASAHAPQRIEFADEPFEATDDGGYGGLAVVPRAGLLALRDDLLAAVTPLISETGAGRPFHPHLTLYQNAGPAQLGEALKVGPRFDTRVGFEATSVDVVGLSGPPGRGVRDILESFALRGVASRR